MTEQHQGDKQPSTSAWKTARRLAAVSIFMAGCAGVTHPEPTPTRSIPSTATAIIPTETALPSTAIPKPTGTEVATPVETTGVHLTSEMQQRATKLAEQTWNNIKQNYLLSAGQGAKRLVYDPNTKNSDAEVDAYGMLASVYLGDETTFQQLWKFQQRHINGNGVISWLYNPNGTIADPNSATDSTQDIAAALILANKRGWKGDYVQSAKRIVSGSLHHETQPGTFIPRGGDYEGSGPTNPSYYDFYHYQLFSQFDPRWQNVKNASMLILDNTMHQIRNGAVKSFPDWVNSNGSPSSGVENSAKIGYDSTRIPIRMMIAARLLTGGEQQVALEVLKQYNAFYESLATAGPNQFDISRIKDGYTLQGKLTPGQHFPETAFASAAVVASMVSDNPAYREYMFKQLPNLVVGYPFNDYMALNAELALSDRLQSIS